MTNNTDRVMGLVAGLVVVGLAVLAASLPSIHAWEKARGYPYGKMCNSVFTGYVDTCNHHQREG
jgi:hypothetical protein